MSTVRNLEVQGRDLRRTSRDSAHLRFLLLFVFVSQEQVVVRLQLLIQTKKLSVPTYGIFEPRAYLENQVCQVNSEEYESSTSGYYQQSFLPRPRGIVEGAMVCSGDDQGLGARQQVATAARANTH